jgi:hypothetical protein
VFAPRMGARGSRCESRVRQDGFGVMPTQFEGTFNCGDAGALENVSLFKT